MGRQALHQHRMRIPGKLGINTNQWRRRWSRSASELGVGPEDIIPTIRKLPKAQEVDGLWIRIASLISKNSRLETQVADRNRRAEAAEAQTLVRGITGLSSGGACSSGGGSRSCSRRSAGLG